MHGEPNRQPCNQSAPEPLHAAAGYAEWFATGWHRLWWEKIIWSEGFITERDRPDYVNARMIRAGVRLAMLRKRVRHNERSSATGAVTQGGAERKHEE